MKSVNKKSKLIPLFILSTGLLLPLQMSQAQILELDQKIFGMDCAPCAKGVETRMMNMNGVDQATLDLNRGEASLVFTDNHNTSLAQLQQSIVDGGFSPKEAQIKVQGTLGRDGQQWKLVTEAGDIFLLEGINAESSQIGQQLLVEGVVEEQDNQEDFWRLTVRQVQSAG